MRLLQLSTGRDQLIDLHPNVAVVAGLDDDGRRALVDTVLGLAGGNVAGHGGLLEAHGLLFDLTDEMLGLLDVTTDGLRPIVTNDDLPTVRSDPRALERVDAERAVTELEERLAVAGEEQQRLQAARDDASAALEVARRNATESDAGAADRIRLIDELTAELDRVEERRRRLLEEQATRGPEADAAQTRRLEVEEATIAVRTRRQEAAILCSELAGRLDEARLGLDPIGAAEADAAREELERVEAEIEAERAAERKAGDAPPEDEVPPAERLANVQTQIEELEKRLVAFSPTEVFAVSTALSELRSRLDGELVESPAALDLADQLAVLEGDLAATAGVGASSRDVAVGRARLDGAQHALLEAEQAVRNPELDRELVERLELAHADLLEALEKADGRFAGGRAQRRVEAARGAEQSVLDELGFGSYADYMMGYSLLNVDPEKEATLEEARVELSAAEDEWRRLEAEIEAELARAERMERRRLLLDQARGLLGRPVAVGVVVDELRSLRVPAGIPPELDDHLQKALDDVGVAVRGEDLSRDELTMLAEAWLAEADDSTDRERQVQAALAALSEERVAALAAVEAEQARLAAEGPRPEEARQARLEVARATRDSTEARRLRHLEADAAVTALTAELAGAAEAERLAAAAASDADAAVGEATTRADGLAADVVRIAEELDALNGAEAEANEHLQSLTEQESATPEQLATAAAEAEAGFALADDRLRVAAAALQALSLERDEARTRATSFDEAVTEPIDESAIAEEIEWYLLARLAAQRSVSLAGSLPLLLDDALVGLDEEQLGHVLGRLERMADAVQVIVLTDDPMAASWADMAGQDRAAVVKPQSA